MGSTIKRLILASSAVLIAAGLFSIVRASIVGGRLRVGNPVGDRETQADLRAEHLPIKRVRAVVRRQRGGVVKEGQRCEFVVERRDLEGDDFYCNAQVRCGKRLLYGGPERGFFRCDWHEDGAVQVVGSDRETTRSDHDAALFLDTYTGVMRIWDDATGPLGTFEIEADLSGLD